MKAAEKLATTRTLEMNQRFAASKRVQLSPTCSATPYCKTFLWATFALSIIGIGETSPFDPHDVPTEEVFFEGWFSRITSAGDEETSLAVIIGAFSHRGTNNLTENWVAFIESNGTMVTRQILDITSDIDITRRSTDALGAPSSFRVDTSSATIDVDGANIFIEYNGSLHVNTTASRTPWSLTYPDALGPEGWAAMLPTDLLPCHYFIHTLASPVEYSLHGRTGLTGYLHMETNYGRGFPSAWIWAQASQGLDAQLVLTYALFDDVIPVAFLAYRTRAINVTLRSTDLGESLDIVKLIPNSSAILEGRNASILIRIAFTAPPNSFSTPLYVPTRQGALPGAVESYQATARVSVLSRDDCEREEVLEARVFHSAALEFGGRSMQ